MAPPPVRRDRERNAARILDAAIGVLGERPEATMAEIAEATGLGRATVYRHYPTREALLAAIRDDAVAATASVLDASRLDDGPADAALERFIRGCWEIHDRHRLVISAIGPLSGPSAVLVEKRHVTDRVAALIARGQAAGEFRADRDPAWLATSIHGIVFAAVDAVGEGILTPAAAPDAILDSARAALAHPRPSKQP